MAEDTHAQRAHSDLGGSGVERWENCPGSVALLKRLREALLDMGIPLDSDEPDYRREGTAMHEAAEHCLTKGLDTWEIVGHTFNETEIDGPMSNAIQVYLDRCRQDMDKATAFGVEARISSPIHPEFYGTTDFWAFLVHDGIVPPRPMNEVFGDNYELVVRDLKGGEGIIVEPDDNPQLKYYAFGIIDGWERRASVELHPDLKVRLSICQPRAFHHTGQVTREWVTTVGEIKAWVKAILVPAMLATEYDHGLKAGEWCRFCPAKLICPLLVGLARAAAVHDPKEIVSYSDENIGRSYQHVQAIKFYLKALEEEAFTRLNRGRTMDGFVKLVPKKANRVYSVGASVIKDKFGDDAMTKPEVKSPAELEKVSPAAAEWVKEHAYMPQTGLTVALWSDKRPGVRVKSAAETFGPALADLLDKTPEAE